MSINLIGNYPKHTRIETGCLSFDWAVAGVDLQKNTLYGMPLRCGWHIYSAESGVGKTTFTLSLMGIIAKATGGNLAISPVDTFDVSNLITILEYAGMNEKQDVEIILDEKSSHSKTLSMLNKALTKKGYVASLLDSAYAVMSTAVEEGEPEDGSVGRDAKLISTYVRQAKHVIDTSPKEDKTFFVTNMTFDDFNAPRSGFGPPPKRPARGKTLMGLTSIHIELSQEYVRKKAVRDDIGRLLKGKVKKNNFGPTLREFRVYTVGGVGIHVGLTALYDLLTLGIAEEKVVGKPYKVILKGEVLETTSYYIEHWDNPEIFKPFLSAITEKRNFGDLPEEPVIEEDDGETPEELFNG